MNYFKILTRPEIEAVRAFDYATLFKLLQPKLYTLRKQKRYSQRAALVDLLQRVAQRAWWLSVYEDRDFVVKRFGEVKLNKHGGIL